MPTWTKGKKSRRKLWNKPYLMKFQHMIVPEALPTDVTRVGFFPGVRPGMHFQLFWAGKPFSAHSAHVRLFPRVSPHMYDQLSGLNESLGTHSAFVRPLARMDTHVPVKLTTVFKCSRTDLQQQNESEIRPEILTRDQ